MNKFQELVYEVRDFFQHPRDRIAYELGKRFKMSTSYFNDERGTQAIVNLTYKGIIICSTSIWIKEDKK